MERVIVNIGDRYGRWTVVRETQKKITSSGQTHRRCLCLCDCGIKKEVFLCKLRSGDSKSCGCLQKELLSKRKKTHGLSKAASYCLWKTMQARCKNFKQPSFKYYGKRGITICKRWMKFENFLEDMGERPKGKSLDRIDNNGDYKPKNCRWTTRKKQSNNKRNNIFVSVNGVQIPFEELAEMFDLKKKTLESRLRRGWSLEKALTKPLRKW